MTNERARVQPIRGSPGVDAGVVALAAADAPAHDADLSPGGAGADGHGAARVTLGGTFFYVFIIKGILKAAL